MSNQSFGALTRNVATIFKNAIGSIHLIWFQNSRYFFYKLKVDFFFLLSLQIAKTIDYFVRNYVVSDSIVSKCLAKISSNDEKQTQIFKQNFKNLFDFDRIWICIFGIGYWICNSWNYEVSRSIVVKSVAKISSNDEKQTHNWETIDKLIIWDVVGLLKIIIYELTFREIMRWADQSKTIFGKNLVKWWKTNTQLRDNWQADYLRRHRVS